MRKVFCFLLSVAVLGISLGCSHSNNNYGYPLWLPTKGDYLKCGTGFFKCTVTNGDVTQSEIAFTSGGEHLKATWSTGDAKVNLRSAKQIMTVSVPLSYLPNLVNWTADWVQETDYHIQLHPLDATTDIPLSDGFALADCLEGCVKPMIESYTADDVMGVFVITSPEHEDILWKIYIVPSC